MSLPNLPNPEPLIPAEPVQAPKGGLLDLIERIGNKFPEPAILFAMLTAAVIIGAAIASAANWRVQPVRSQSVMVQAVDSSGAPKVDEAGKAVMVPKLNDKGKPVVALVPTNDPELRARSLLTGEGLYWFLSSMVRNFTGLPALGLIFVSMLGIGLAEKFGLFGALMRALALATPKKYLTPMVIFIGANSSVASDAGYIILPPLAAALYLAIGRHPIAGLAAAFAGVAGGFGAGCFPTAGDGFLAGVATNAAHILNSAYPDVTPTHNFYFKIGSAIVVTFAGWYVTDRIVEPRLKRLGLRDANQSEVSAGASTLEDLRLKPIEKKGLVYALIANIAVVAVFAAMVLIPGWPLSGTGVPVLADERALTTTQIVVQENANDPVPPGGVVLYEDKPKVDPKTNAVNDDGLRVLQAPGTKAKIVERPGDRWSQAIVPLIFFCFLIPGMAYGMVTGTLRSQKDFIEALYHGIRSIVPVLAIMFFLGQFVNCFSYTGLDRMLAFTGGSLLVQFDLPVPVLIVAFVLLVIAGDFAMSGMLSKFGVLAPIFIPMFMMVGMSPELTTAAYRIGDSVVNIITPLNSYLLIILAVLCKYKKDAGLGSLMSLMLPYSVIFFLTWTGFLLIWYYTGADLGPDAPLHPPVSAT
ncbi:MAG: AbgT family transporter [Phycisphaerales bacterium]|nr:AbgT family transporter [Phycisphaerales bacterium]